MTKPSDDNENQLGLQDLATYNIIRYGLFARFDHTNTDVASEEFCVLNAIYQRKPSLAFMSFVAYSDSSNIYRAIKELKYFPQILLCEFPQSVIGPDQHPKQGSAIQIALSTHDTRLLSELLWGANWRLDRIFYRRLEAQVRTIFPEGIQDAYINWKPYDFASLVKVITNSSDETISLVLSKSSNRTPLQCALNEFRIDFKETVNSELAYNPKHLMEAFNLYKSHKKSWSMLQALVFWLRVIGVVQSHIPIPYARAYLFGLREYATSISTPNTIHLTFKKNDRSFYPYIDSNNQERGLGIDWAAAPWRYLRLDAAPNVQDIEISLCAFATLVNKNIEEMIKLEQFIQDKAEVPHPSSIPEEKNACTII